MIRPIDIRLNAAHPELPLAEAVTFTGSPSTALIRGVPPNCGRWAITAVFVAATFPDGSTTTRAAVQSANGVWVATLPATARSGRTENGLRVMADGIDENGAAVTGYILGVADFAVASLGVTPAPQPGETSWQMLYFDAVPSTLRKGDVAKVDGVLKLYNGTAWEAFAGDIPAPSTATPAMDGAGSAGTSEEYARGDHVHPTDTSRVPTSRTVNGQLLSSDVTLDADDVGALPAEHDGSYYDLTNVGIDDLNLPSGTHVNGEVPILSGDVVAPDSSATSGKVADAEATYQALDGKQSALSAQQLANIAAVPDKLGKTVGGTVTGDLSFQGAVGVGNTLFVNENAAFGFDTNDGVLQIKPSRPIAAHEEVVVKVPVTDGTLALTAGTGHAGNLAALDANGNPTDSTIPAANVALKGDIPYDRITITTGQLQDRAVQKVSLSAASTTLTLPALTDLTGKVSDFGIDMVNAYEVSDTPTAASFTLAGTIGTDYNLIVPKGDDWSEMTALAAGEMAQFYFTLSSFQLDSKPTWKVVKQVVQKVTIPTVTP